MGHGLWFTLKRLYAEAISPPSSTFTPAKYPDLTGSIALVTGASSGIGIDLVKLLASKNCHVLMGIRNKNKGEAVRNKILKELGKNGGNSIGSIDLIVMDLADLESLKTVPGQISSIVSRLDIIIHNAGLVSAKMPPTKQGFEGIFGTNTIGTFFLQKQLDKLFLIRGESPYKRIVWLSSAYHHISPPNGGLDWDKIKGKTSFKNEHEGYAISKTAIIYLSYYWGVVHEQELLKNDKVLSLHSHPGFLNTEIARDSPLVMRWITSLFAHPLIKGAHTELFAAISPTLNSKEHQGAYICPWGVVGEMRDDVKEGYTNGTAKKVWDYLEEITAKY